MNILAKALRLSDRDTVTSGLIESLGAGWTAEEALAIAIFVVMSDADFEGSLRLAVNHDGDSDSTGSLVGNILGAMHGASVLPRKWLDRLELREVIAGTGRALLARRRSVSSPKEDT